MAKHQKWSSYQLYALPDEVILKLFGFLEIKELLLCGQVSKRLRAIANDESLWLKLNLWGRKVPYDFIEKVIGNGCQYLSLANCDIQRSTGNSEPPSKLKYFNMSQLARYRKPQDLPKLLQNCHSLQKLSVANLPLDSEDIQYICQSGQTLQVLDLEACHIQLQNQAQLLQDLFTNCANLTELNIGSYANFLLDHQIQPLVDNLTPTILKLDLKYQYKFNDEHVKKLVKRCNKLTHLDLRYTCITNDSMHSIIKHLNLSLEKLSVSKTKVDFATLIELKSMTSLKTLICCFSSNNAENIKNLKLKLPHIRISQERYLFLASPFDPVMNRSIDRDWIWEIKAKQQDLFPSETRD